MERVVAGPIFAILALDVAYVLAPPSDGHLRAWCDRFGRVAVLALFVLALFGPWGQWFAACGAEREPPTPGWAVPLAAALGSPLGPVVFAVLSPVFFAGLYAFLSGVALVVSPQRGFLVRYRIGLAILAGYPVLLAICLLATEPDADVAFLFRLPAARAWGAWLAGWTVLAGLAHELAGRIARRAGAARPEGDGPAP